MTSKKILLVRHGNTFAPGDKVVWVGARSDMPLVPKGREQARLFGDAVRGAGLAVGPLRAGPLRRTRDFVREAFGVAAEIDDRLTEIDYGSWEGRTNEEVAAEFGKEPLEAWNKRGVWPRKSTWKPSIDQVEANVAQVVADLAALTEPTIPVACTSQGILKFFAKRDAAFHARALSQTEGNAISVPTGACCGVTLIDGRLRVDFWAQPPSPALLKDWTASS